MILNSPYISGSLTVTGNTTIQGQLTVTGSLSGTASLASNALLLQGTGSTGFATTASLLQVSSSQQQISSSLLQVSASYIALSGSYTTFSGSASTRITVDSASLQQVSSSQQQISSSQQQISASLLTLTASYTALSSSYTALSSSYNTFSGSASTRTTQIEQVYATTGSNSFRANQSITGSLVVSSTITAQTLVVQTVTSSIVYSSGSNLFGSALTDRQTFTGSVNITGSSHAIFGNVGIGTTNPTSSLDVSGNVYIRSSSGGVLYIPRLADTSHGLSIGEQSIIGSKSAVIRTAGGVSEHLFIDPGSNDSNVAGNIALAYANTGSVGIGTYLPSTKLQVVGLTGGASGGATGIPSLGFANSSSIALFTNKDTNYGTLFGTLNTGVGWIQQQRVDGTGTAYNLLLQPNGGNVGIGSCTPGDLLHVEKCQAGGMGMIIRNSCGATSNTSMCSLISLQLVGAGQTGQIGINLIAGKEGDYSSAGVRNAFFAIQTACGDNLYERLRITSTGNVGISTCVPSQQLSFGMLTNSATRTYTTDNQGTLSFYNLTTGNLEAYLDIASVRTGNDSTLGGSNIRFLTQTVCSITSACERMRITAGGNIGIATSSPESYLAAKLVVSTTAQNDGITIVTNNSTYQNNLYFARGTSGSDRSRGAIAYNHNTDTLTFVTNDTGRMNINCVGDVTIGTGESRHLTIDSTSGNYSYLYLKAGTNDGYLLQNVNGCTTNGVTAGAMYAYMSQAQNFEFVWSAVSKIKFTSTGLSCFAGTVCAPCFATISDYRMKSNIRPIDGLSIIMNTKPYKFEYNYDCSTSFGMIAHELQDTLPEAVFGQKDGEVMQGVDYMKLLPIAIKAIQELKAEIDELKNK